MALDLWQEMARILGEFETRGIDYAVVGAIALAVHGAPRATTDIDLLVPHRHLESALAAAAGLGFSIRALPMRFSDGMEVHRVTKVEDGDTLTLDLLLVDVNLEQVWADRRRVTTDFGDAWVVSRQGLMQMKAWAGREQDLADIRRLEDLDR